MWKVVLAGTAALAIAGSGLVYAQQRGEGPQQRHWQFSQEDRDAFAAARIAALRAGLALTPEQEKLWPPFETALKDLFKVRSERRQARRDEQPSRDPTERLRRRAEALGDYSVALKKLADAQEPLYSGLNDAQKRRFAMLSHRMRAGWGHHRHHRGFGRDRGHWRGPERGMEREGMMHHRMEHRARERRDLDGGAQNEL